MEKQETENGNGRGKWKRTAENGNGRGKWKGAQLFYVQLLTNSRISRCQGCRGAIEHGLHSPHNIVIQHKEHVLFQNPHTGNWQLSRDLRNTYYHPFLNCIAPKHPDFSSSELKVSQDVKDRLDSSHLQLLLSEFGLQI